MSVLVWVLVVHLSWPGFSGVSTVTIGGIADEAKCNGLGARVEQDAAAEGGQLIRRDCYRYLSIQ